MSIFHQLDPLSWKSFETQLVWTPVLAATSSFPLFKVFPGEGELGEDLLQGGRRPGVTHVEVVLGKVVFSLPSPRGSVLVTGSSEVNDIKLYLGLVQISFCLSFTLKLILMFLVQTAG